MIYACTGISLVLDAVRTHDNHYPGGAHKIVLLNSKLITEHIDRYFY